MKTISGALQTHLEGSTVTIAMCAKVVRADATEFYFTEHDQPIIYDGDTYEPSSIILSSNINSTSNISVDNLEVGVAFDSASITEADVIGGLYNNAEVFLFIINWADTSQGILRVFRGTLGEKRIEDGSMSIEVRSLSQKLQQRIGRAYNQECDAYVGDARCGVNLVPFTVTGIVTSVTSRVIFTDSSRLEADDHFNFGTLTWTSGNNQGLQMEVKDFGSGQFTLFEPMPNDVQVNDDYSVHRGCDRKASTCQNIFNNYPNNRAFPHIPGIDKATTLFNE